MFAVCLTGVYYFYFLINMYQLSSISNVAALIDNKNYVIAAKMTISSLCSMCIIFGVLICILVNSTLNLTATSLFIAKVLPYSDDEIRIANKILKLFLALIIFELILIIVMPTVRLIRVNFIGWIVLLLEFHLIYIDTFLVIDFIYEIISSFSYENNLKFLIRFTDMFLVLMDSIYFFVIRFKIDYQIGHAKSSVLLLMLIILICAITILGIMIFITDKLKFQSMIFKNNKYINIYLPNLLNEFKLVFAAILRTPNYIYTSIVIVTVFLYSLLYNSLTITFSNMLFIFPLIGVVGINYANSSLKVRSYFDFFRVKIIFELLAIILTGGIILFPTLILSFYQLKNGEAFVFGLTIYLSSIILGFLLPKSYGNLNETLSSILIIIVIILISLSLAVSQLLYGICILLMGCVYITIKNGRKKDL